jgi:hypothetical protein
LPILERPTTEKPWMNPIKEDKAMITTTNYQTVKELVCFSHQMLFKHTHNYNIIWKFTIICSLLRISSSSLPNQEQALKVEIKFIP